MSPAEEFDRCCRELLSEGAGAVAVDIPDGLIVADYHRVVEEWRERGWVPQMGMAQVVFYSREYLHAEINRSLDERLADIEARRAELQRQTEALDERVSAALREAAEAHVAVDRGDPPVPYDAG